MTVSHEASVLAAWIDDNEHMNLAYYVLVFTDAIAAMDIGSPRLTQLHTVYEREVTLGDRLLVTTHVLAVEPSGLHLFQEMFHAADGYRAATLESVAVPGAALGSDIRARLAASITDPPPGAGRRIAMQRGA